MAKRTSKRDQDKKLKGILDSMVKEAKPFLDCSPKACSARRAKAKGDLDYFCRTYLPHYFDTPLSPFHQKLAKLTEIKGKPVATCAARGHGKTTLLKGKVLRDIVFEVRKLILIISATEDSASAITAALRQELEENPRLKADFGNLADKSGGCWSDGEFRTKTGIKIVAKGRGQSLRGISNGPHRPDLAILDDLEDDEQAASPKRVKKVIGYIRRVVIPALARKARWSLFWVGTILATNSALDQALATGKSDFAGWERHRFNAIQKDGTALCPELHSLDDLARIKIFVGSVAFNQEYMNNPVNPNGIFREEWLTTYRPEAHAADLERGMTVAFIDPSVKQGELSDFKAIVVVTVHPSTSDIYVRDAWIRQASIDAMIRAVYDIQARYSCTVIGLEAVGFSSLLFRDFDAAAKEFGHHLPLRPVGQTLNKQLRIASIGTLNERGKIFYPQGWPGDLGLLKEQKLAFPSTSVNDDGPDAEEGAIRLCEMTVAHIDYKSIASRRFGGGLRDRCRDLDLESYSHAGTRGGGW